MNNAATRSLVALTIVLMAVAGCSAGDGDPIDAPPTQSSSAFEATIVLRDRIGTPEVTVVVGAPTEPPTTHCGEIQPRFGDIDDTLRSGDLDRTYILHIPPQYDGVTPLPVVLNFHGFGSNARNQAGYSRLPRKADEAGFIVVSPDGAGTPPQWNNAQSPAGVDDVAFVSDLLGHLEATLCIDSARIYAAGISNGAAFSSRLACNMPERIAGIALMAALIYPIVCDGDTPVPVIAFHGTADACVPYEGGVTACGRGGLPVQPVETYAESWARHNDCNLEPARSPVTEHVRATAYSECTDEVAVVLYTVEGGGHTWPGSIDVPRLGAVTGEIDATDLLWEFFEAQAP